ncbi:APC family permease [Luteipulveratus sp. YIM 133132]|uniref:APC family permease n=1 Tax=Luteipulveratus flavus TaxID=3031728 RepID=UPI0023AF03F0|nr:APC family permease [Luteipulveratus sp. YIM 133132]MDE9366785.1 APC family permease [Luteipulveratus sp. YIM 133132]
MSHVTEAEPVGPRAEQPELKRVMGPKLLLLFIVGDILGTGIYALTGEIAGEVGGAAWAPFLLAFAIAMVTAFSYLELVTKYPAAGGAAVFVHKAFGVHFVTFVVCFAVMCSGITSASTASQAFASNLAKGLEWEASDGQVMLIALGFMLLVMLINLRGVGESVRANVVLTLVEVSGLLLVILVGFWAMTQGKADFSRVTVFESPSDKSTFLAVTAATSLAFFAMVGFEDSVNMAEETKDPVRIFPRMMITGITVTGIIYVLVSICAVALVPIGELAGSETPLVTVVEKGAPDLPIERILPFISMFAVANSALINMLMASRLLYGLSRQEVLPRPLGRVLPGRRTPWVAILFTTAIAFGLISYVTSQSGSDIVKNLGGTTSLLLLAVFSVVNVAVLVLRRDHVGADHFRTPTYLPVVGAITCAFLVLPKLSGRDSEQYVIAGWLLLLGLVLWVITWFVNRAFYAHRTYLHDPDHLEDD